MLASSINATQGQTDCPCGIIGRQFFRLFMGEFHSPSHSSGRNARWRYAAIIGLVTNKRPPVPFLWCLPLPWLGHKHLLVLSRSGGNARSLKPRDMEYGRISSITSTNLSWGAVCELGLMRHPFQPRCTEAWFRNVFRQDNSARISGA
jgi:hypothetical protein